MSDEAPPKKKEGGGGAPAWVMTFADLMSLLMCFFVLLLSFSEMDLQKFKQIAGSMKTAFGVQKEIKTDDAPKGTSIIAQQFSPGRPTPTLINEIRQTTIDETRQTLEFTDAMTEDHNKESIDPNEDNEGSGAEAMRRQPVPQSENSEQQIDKTEMAKLSDKEEQKLEQVKEENEKPNNKEIQKENLQKNEKTVADAYRLLKTLEPEMEQGLVEIKTQGNRILLRINEKGSFPSGSAVVKGSFIPVLNKLRKSLSDIQGNIIVSGHTDNIPIKTARFRSNWELSASRAVTVVHELLAMETLLPERFIVEGHGDAHPVVPNDTPENRALNRRVEITIVQQEENDDAVNIISVDNPFKNRFEGAKTPQLTENIKKILEQEIITPEKPENADINLEELKNQFEKIREGIQNQ